MKSLLTEPDVLVIGAGPAGAMAASTLARAGRNVLCTEQDWFPRYALGESLLPRCTPLLDKAGLLRAVERRGYQVKRGVTFDRNGRSRRLAFKNGLPGDPESTFHVPRDDFDRTLATAARAQGADIRFGLAVTSLTRQEADMVVTLRDLATGSDHLIRPRFLLDCSGYGRVIGQLLGLTKAAGKANRRALFTMVEGDRRPLGEASGDLAIHLLPDGWAWLIPFSDQRTSVGVVSDRACLGESGDHEARLLSLLASSSSVARRLADAVCVQPVRSMTRWPASIERLHGNGWAVAGNAGKFLDPIFSSGVCLALEFAALAAKLVDRTLAEETVQWQIEYVEPVERALSIFRFFVESWYDGVLPELLFSDRLDEPLLRGITSALGGNVLRQDNVAVEDLLQSAKGAKSKRVTDRAASSSPPLPTTAHTHGA